MNARFKRAVEERLRKQRIRHLIPVFSSVCAIPERLYEYNDRLFVVFNIRTQKYELHNLDHHPYSLAMQVPYDELDVRILRRVWKNDIRVHGRRIFIDLDQENDRVERSKKRHFQNELEAVIKDTRTMFARDAWGDPDSKVLFPAAK